MVQIAPAGVAFPLVNSAAQDFTPRRVNDQQTARPVREPEETDEGGDEQSAAVIVDARNQRIEDERKKKEDDERFREEQERREAERRPGNRLDLRI